jgi:hypothetical protein
VVLQTRVIKQMIPQSLPGTRVGLTPHRHAESRRFIENGAGAAELEFSLLNAMSIAEHYVISHDASSALRMGELSLAFALRMRTMPSIMSHDGLARPDTFSATFLTDSRTGM